MTEQLHTAADGHDHLQVHVQEHEERALLVLYATETGNSLDVAERVARAARRHHFHTRVAAMDDYPLTELINETLVVFVLSTTGTGQEPRPMAPLWNVLLRSDLPHDLFDHLDYAVFGLGDSAYEKFNWAAKKLARRLESLGARHIVERGEGDEQHRFGVYGALVPWMKSLFDALLEMHPLPEGALIESDNTLGSSRVTMTLAPPAPESAPGSLKENTLPHHYFGSLAENKRITAEGWTQDVRHFTIAFDEDIEYAPGDVALLYPEAHADDVDSFLLRLGWADADAPLLVRPTSSDLSLPAHFPAEGTVTLREILTKYVDIAAVPRLSFFEVIRHFTDDEQHREKLEDFCTEEGQDDLYDYVHRVRRTIVEVLAEFKSVRIPKEYVFDVFPPMRPRMFSIASSLKMHPRQIQLCIAIVTYRTRLKTPRKGVCTTYLSRLGPGSRIRVGFQTGTMTLPEDPSTPILCVGPGTGVAPMRAIIEERVSSGARNNTLYFGCRSSGKDEHYAAEWAQYAAEQVLDYQPAFSRDAPAASGMPAAHAETREKVYVQDLIRRDASAVWACLRDGGMVYIAGSANQMPKAVRAALVHAAATCGALSIDDAQALLVRLEREGRLFEEGWN